MTTYPASDRRHRSLDADTPPLVVRAAIEAARTVYARRCGPAGLAA